MTTRALSKASRSPAAILAQPAVPLTNRFTLRETFAWRFVNTQTYTPSSIKPSGVVAFPKLEGLVTEYRECQRRDVILMQSPTALVSASIPPLSVTISHW